LVIAGNVSVKKAYIYHRHRRRGCRKIDFMAFYGFQPNVIARNSANQFI
jgi:hypothetical protein